MIQSYCEHSGAKLPADELEFWADRCTKLETELAHANEELKWRRGVHAVTGEADKLKAENQKLSERADKLKGLLLLADPAVSVEEWNVASADGCGRRNQPNRGTSTS